MPCNVQFCTASKPPFTQGSLGRSLATVANKNRPMIAIGRFNCFMNRALNGASFCLKKAPAHSAACAQERGGIRSHGAETTFYSAATLFFSAFMMGHHSLKAITIGTPMPKMDMHRQLINSLRASRYAWVCISSVLSKACFRVLSYTKNALICC